MLGLSVPVSVVGVALFTSGSVSIRMSAHAEAIANWKYGNARNA